MGADASKRKQLDRYANIDPNLLAKLLRNISSPVDHDFKTNESAMKLFPLNKGEIVSNLFSKLQENGSLRLSKLLGILNLLVGDTSDQSQALLSLFGGCRETVEYIASLFSAEQKLSKKDSRIFLNYFSATLPSDDSLLHNWMENNPLFTQLVYSIYNPLIGKSPPLIFPHLEGGVCSVISSKAALAALNFQLPMERREKWTLLFNSVTHGNSFSQLNKRINGEGPSLIFIQSNSGNVFGCFASEGFVSGPQYRGDERCFLFEAYPNLRIHLATGRSQNYAYMNCQQATLPNGLGMGGYDESWPFFIHEEYGTGICVANMASFDKCCIALQPSFEIRNMEVWRVGDKPLLTEEEEDHIRKEKSIIDKDPEAKALLELSGRKMHSEAYREAAPILEDS